MKFLLVAVLSTGVLTGCATTHEHVHRHPSDIEGAEAFHGHESESDKVAEETQLPQAFMFKDLNENGVIDKDEARADNLEVQLGGNTAWANRPIIALGLQRGQLMLTIDDGPHRTLTPKILKLLHDHNIKATFFVTGDRIKGHADIIRQIYREGHTIGNHTYSHRVRSITSTTIKNEILKAHNVLVEALGHQPEGRLLFRAPGLAWNTPKATNLNADSVTRKFIGPIHANLGTDAPKADWHCWSKGKSAETCASYYFDVITNKGRGIVLAHDIYYKNGRGNTYEMLRLLFRKLERAGGIKNSSPSGQGVWEFVRLEDSHSLDKLDAGVITDAPREVGPSIPFKSANYNVRSGKILNEDTLTDSSKIALVGGGGYLKTGHILKFDHLNETHRVSGHTFKKVRIIEMMPGERLPADIDVYISSKVFK